MKFKFKIQSYQTEAVKNTTDIFTGQPNRDASKYRRDLGKQGRGVIHFDGDDDGYRNADVELTSKQLLENLHSVQTAAGVQLSKSLSNIEGLGAVNLDVEMETGTGKTYVYIKTMFELNKLYGWSKFIIVVPSIAIREGVAKSFRMLEEHFMEQYGKKARWFVYNSSNLNQLDQFSQDAGLNVMIINTQAFATSMKEGGRSKESRIIYSKRDEFASRRPIDVIAANRPVIIMDEPQKMEGAATQTALKKFNPLFVLNYSATHKTKHDTVYALDALDAYRERLVKRIKVIGFELKNLRGTNGYMYLDNIILSPSKPPMARISIEVKNVAGEPRRHFKTFGVGDSLFIESNELLQYKDYTIAEIFPGSNTQPVGYVTFTNGVTLRRGDVVGDTNELHMQRVQIRETIKAHFEKERLLFKKGIKCLSLFFIDEVVKYRSYDSVGNPVKGIFQQIFEEEYARLVNDEFHIFDEEYNKYLRRFAPYQTHRGYFSIDKKGKMIDTKTKRGSDISEEASDYDLILRDKERLLSFDEPTRFIFSHSALREGWDNPNVFQICTLRHSNSTTAKRQEVGRGLRICVDKNGIRQDKELLGDEVHNINVLTVIANESYANFTKDLQRETREALRERASKASTNYFEGKTIKVDGLPHVITDSEAARIMIYLEDNDVSDRIDNIHTSMKKYLSDGVFEEYKNAMVYVERTQSNGILRQGIVGAIDLEKYDFSKGSNSEVRATEATVIERIPPRIKVRQGADLELPHIMILIDDPDNTVIEPLAQKQMQKLYDFELMQNGGSIKGYLLDGQTQEKINSALCELADPEKFREKYGFEDTPVLLYAMGDGNHSLATAKEFYEQLKKANPDKDFSNHPARYALAEIVNLHSDALKFEAIHRLVYDVDCNRLISELTEALKLSESKESDQYVIISCNGTEKKMYINKKSSNLSVGSLQNFLDGYIKSNGGKIDYIHGTDTVKNLAEKHNGIAFILPDMDKSQLFPTVIKDGALPRKTFSMGHAEDKRFYIEARKITE